MDSGREILEKFDYLKTDRISWESEWQEITRLVIPRRSLFEDTKGRGDRTGQDIYDGTAISALNLLANGLMGYLMGPMLRWFKLGLPEQRAMDMPGVRQWLEFVENILYADFARSTLYEEGLEFFKDGGSISTATMYMEEDHDEGVPFFSTRHPKEVYLGADRRNRIDTVFRRYFMTARQMVQEFGEKDVPEPVRISAKQSPSDKYEVIHAVYPREDRDVSKLNGANKKYASVYVDAATEEILRVSGFDDLPYVVWRWGTNSDEVYGRGPGHDALVKVKRANAMARDIMQYSQLTVQPPYNVPEQMRGKTAILPRGLNYYSSPDQVISPVPLGGSYPIGLDQQQDIREIIENDFLVDFFLMLQRAPERMTATEVMERQAEKAAVLGPIIGRIESDVLDKIIALGFKQAYNAGRIPPPPPALQQLSGMPIKVEYIGPLAQANRKFHVQQGIQNAVNQFVPLLQVEPSMHGLVKWDELGRKMLQEGGMPADIVRDEREYRKWQEQMAAAQQAAQEQAAQQEIVQNADKLSKAPEDGSPMDALTEQMRGTLATMQGRGA